ncbi:hypothetical protein [Terrarubrum flagellatum]|uniref:hypothetical protein n=1 Tax=Terrirubrum flagellatum TaxID=2895980 RepID=UPI00314557D8
MTKKPAKAAKKRAPSKAKASRKDESAGAVADVATPAVVDATQFAAIAGINVRNTRQLAQSGVLVRAAEKGKFKTQASIRAYLEHLRAQAAGRLGTGKLILTDERARLAKEQADKQAIENAKLRAELYSEKEVAAGWTAIARAFKSAVLSLPSKTRAQLPHMTAEDAVAMDRLCRELLEDLAKEIQSIEIVGGGDEADEGSDGVDG